MPPRGCSTRCSSTIAAARIRGCSGATTRLSVNASTSSSTPCRRSPRREGWTLAGGVSGTLWTRGCSDAGTVTLDQLSRSRERTEERSSTVSMQGQQTQQGQQGSGQWQQQQKQHARNKTVFSFTADIPPGQFAPLA